MARACRGMRRPCPSWKRLGGNGPSISMPKNVVLLSGGLDSTVVLGLACWRDRADEVIALSMSYGQRHINEIHHAQAIALRAGVRYFRMGIDPAAWKLL